jgi:hypothetical protein
MRYAGVMSAFGGVAAAAIAARNLFTRKPAPASYLIQGGSLSVFDAQGKRLWNHAFENELYEDAYRGERPKCLFCDVDGDGNVEVIFYYCPSIPVAGRRVICFNHDGVRRWEFMPGKSVTDNLNQTYVRPYWPVDIRVFPPDDRYPRRLLVTSVHHWSFPMQAAILDASKGGVIGEYWHRGHLLHSAIAAIGQTGEPKLILGGVIDAVEYKCATLVIFDLDRVGGASCAPTGIPYFKGMPPGLEETIVLFPKTPIDEQEEFNQVLSLLVSTERITVAVGGPVGLIYGSVIYEFDRQLNLLSTVLSVTLRARLLQLQRNSEIPKESFEHLIVRLTNGVRIQFPKR